MFLDSVRGMANFYLNDHLDNLARIHLEVAGRCNDYIQSVLTCVLFVMHHNNFMIPCHFDITQYIMPTSYVTGFTKTILNRTFGNSRNTKLKY